MAANIVLQNHLPEIGEKVRDAALQWLEETAGEVESQTKRAVRTDTGQLKNSWMHQVNADRCEAIVGSPLENALWEEYGTGEFAAEGNGRRTPWYVPVESVTGTKKPTYNGTVIVVYGKDGQAFYKTNGKAPQRTFQNALDEVMPKAKQALEARLREIK